MRRRQQQASIETKVINFINEHHLLATGKTLLVAVSGGPDSICLLHLLTRLQPELKIKLHAAHLNHQLRGANSVADAQYVLDLCHQLGVPVTIGQCDVKAYQSKNKLSLEEAAREARYQFLAEVAESVSADRVAVAHTQDDQVETILLHIIRGTGTRGLRGLQPVTGWTSPSKSLKVVRPLLAVSRKDTVTYGNRHRLHPRTDETNFSTEPLRNRVRLKLLPDLKDYNAGIDEALLRIAHIAGEDIDFLEKSAHKQWHRMAQKQDDKIVLDKAKFGKIPASIQRYVLRMAVEALTGTLKDIEGRHIEEILENVARPAGKQISLPYGLVFSNEYDRYVLRREPEKESPERMLKGEYDIKVPGATKIPGWSIEARIVTPKKMTGDDEYTAYFDFAKVGNKVTVRNRKPGDRFQPLGMSELKKVGQFMLDSHVPRSLRTGVPIVSSETQVLWVVGWRIDERVKVTNKTKKVLRVRFRRSD